MAKSGKKGLKEYELITLDENHALQLKNENLIQRVLNSAIIIEDADAAVKKRDEEKRLKKEWQSFLACDHIPKPFEPTEIRKFFFRVSHYEEKDVELTVNWTSAVEERSILNQDIDSLNMTYRHLKLSRPNFGAQYDTRINEAIVIARNIEDFLEKPTKVLSKRMLQDVEELKFVAFAQVYQYIENLSYRVLCSEDAYMDPIDVTTAEFSYQGKEFDIHLWTFKNVPIYLDPFDTPSKAVNLYKIKTKLVIPFSVLCPNMVIRGLHCQFDHFSAHARYYELPPTDAIEQHLRICLKNEWDTQMKIQAEVKGRVMKQRADFEEALRLKAEEAERAKLRRNKDENEKKPVKVEKPKKPPKEPQIIAPDVVPVIRNDFLHYDFLEFEETMVQFHPDRFGLTRGEVNLRKYQILGGVYQITCLSKPKVVTLPAFIMTWFKTEQRAEHQDIEAHFDTSKSKADVVKFFQITFELPECFCHWGEPIPCLFEEGESYRTANLPDSTESVKVLTDISPVIINDFNLHELFTRTLMYEFIENSIPRIISSFKFPDDLFDEEEDKKAKATLTRAKQTAEELEHEQELAMQKQQLSYDNQKCPERLFPLFKKALPVVILPMQDTNTPRNKLHPYEHFSDFISTLLSIEQSYKASKFKDKQGKPIKILAEKYENNIRRPQKRLSKTIVYDKFNERMSRVTLDTVAMDRSSMRDSSLSLNDSTEQKRKSSVISGQTIEKVETTKHKKGKAAKKIVKEVVVEEEKVEEELETPYSKWSTSNILKSNFNPATRKVTILTDRLGTFGLAYYRYQHFPFTNWIIQPNEENPEEVEVKIESEHAVFRLYVSQDGYRASVTDFTKYAKTRKVYLEIKEPVNEIKILKEILQQKYLNIFPERDAVWYMTGYFSEKHLSAELHTYNCISLYATSLKFRHSIWNKLSNRRTMVLKFGELRDLEEDLFELCIHPEDVSFVDIKELCTDDLDKIELAYKPTWRNFEWYPDLNHLITSTYVHWSEMRTKEPNVVYYLKNLLQAIRPLSCS